MLPELNARPLLINSQGTAAYVLGKYIPIGTGACLNQYIFRYNPTLALTSPDWQIQTSECNPQGITFGSKENVVFHLSNATNTSRLTLFEDSVPSPNWIWTQQMDCQSNIGIISDSKSVTSSQDLIAFACGYSSVNYAVISYSNTSPYNIATKAAFNGINTYNYMRIRGLYIKSQTVLLTAFAEKLMPYHFTIGTVDLVSLKITYQETLPKRGNTKMRRVVFLSDSLYFAAGYQKSMRNNLASPSHQVISNFYHGLVFSSDTSKACYSLRADPPDPSITITTTPLTTASMSSFSLFTDIIITSDISSTKIVSLDFTQLTNAAWCKQWEYISLNTAQSSSSFSYNVGQGFSTAISPFTSTQQCGTVNPSFTYQGINLSNNLPLNPTNDFISVVSTSGQIQVDCINSAGTYNIQILGYLPNKWQFAAMTFTLTGAAVGGSTIVNQPAVFASTSLQNQEVQYKYTIIYKLPSYYDPENCGKVSLYIEPPLLTSFVKYNLNLNQLTISPTLTFQVGIQQAQIILSDIQGLNKTYSFTLTVYDFPRLSGTMKNVALKIGTQQTQDLPIIEEFAPIKISHQPALPSFIVFQYPTYTISPTKKADINSFSIVVTVSNKYLSKQYSFKVDVTNSPPRFDTDISATIEVTQLDSKSYSLPSPKDDENQAVTISTFEKSKSALPTFISFDSGSSTYSINPIGTDKAGKYTIQVDLKDTMGASKSYTFDVKINELATSSSQDSSSAAQTQTSQSSSTSSTEESTASSNDASSQTESSASTSTDSTTETSSVSSTEQQSASSTTASSSESSTAASTSSESTEATSSASSSQTSNTQQQSVQSSVQSSKSTSSVGFKKQTNQKQIKQKAGVYNIVVQDIKAKLMIQSASRQGDMILKVIAGPNGNEIIKNITNKTFSLVITSKNNAKVQYRIVSYDSVQNQIMLKLNFTDPQAISAQTVINKYFQYFRNVTSQNQL